MSNEHELVRGNSAMSIEHFFGFWHFSKKFALQVASGCFGERGGGGGEWTQARMPLSSKSGRAGLCKRAAAAPQGWLLPAVAAAAPPSRHPLDGQPQQPDKTTRTLGARRLDRASTSCRLQPTRHVWVSSICLESPQLGNAPRLESLGLGPGSSSSSGCLKCCIGRVSIGNLLQSCSKQDFGALDQTGWLDAPLTCTTQKCQNWKLKIKKNASIRRYRLTCTFFCRKKFFGFENLRKFLKQCCYSVYRRQEKINQQ